jgi:hypothetical protein
MTKKTAIIFGVTSLIVVTGLVIYFANQGRCVRFGNELLHGDVNCA